MTAEQPELPALPPASERQGGPGHDRAGERMSAIRLLTLKANGLTYAQIAEEAGYADASGARMAILRALDRHEAETATQLRSLENMRLDADERALRAIMADTKSTTTERLRAIDARTRLSARRARMNGLDAPVQVAITSESSALVDDALAELKAAITAGEVVASRPLDDGEDV